MIESLSWIELERLNEEAAIRKTVKQLRINDKALVKEARTLVYETVRRQNSIDFLINEALESDSFVKLKIGLRSFLRLYTYLVHYGGESLTRAYELIDHTIALLGLRDFRDIETIPDLIPSMTIPFNEISDTQRLAYKYFQPSWYVTHLLNEFGEENTKKIIKNVDYPNYIRLNTLKDTSVTLENLYEKGFQLVAEPGLANTYKLLAGKGITDTPDYRSGRFIIQDKASILVGEVAHPEPGDIVLDVCAAPGVKTSHLAQFMQNMGHIFSVDYNPRRQKSWQHFMRFLGVTNAEGINADASKPDGLPSVVADVVVVDPPCTGTGLFHKAPSSKWRLTPHSINNMARLQKLILLNAAQRLKPGGCLVYSTCSIMIKENEEVVQSLLESNQDMRLVEPSPRIGVAGLRGMDEAQRLYSYSHFSDGFFIAKLLKDM